MFRSKRCAWLAAPLLLTLLLPSISCAEFALVDNFDSYNLAAIGGQGPWYAPAPSSEVVLDPANASNQVLSVTAQSTIARRPLTVANGSAHMLFFRFRFGTKLSTSFGLSDSAAPTQIDDFEAELSMSNAESDLRVRDGNHYEPLGSLNSTTWYNLWMMVDNSTNKTQLWLNTGYGEDADAADQLSYTADSDKVDTFFFRNGTNVDLKTFFIKMGSGSSENIGPLFIDDIYLDNVNGSQNLANPVPEPGTFVLALVAFLGLVLIGRRLRLAG